MRCSNPSCNADLYPGDRFCGKCGRSAATPQSPAFNESNNDLFPLYGVMLGVTTVDQLAQMGRRTSTINKSTGRPYECYKINGIDFWYHAGSLAESIYIARGLDAFPERWRALGFDWGLSYNQWINLLQRLGYPVRVENPPRVVNYDGHDSFSAKISAVKQGMIPIEIVLDFNYNRETTGDSPGTLYAISVRALKKG